MKSGKKLNMSKKKKIELEKKIYVLQIFKYSD